ncbi:hypothetical protein EF405_02995 [Cyclobacteriaceae bacterium YHN15]|jgi:hypothetical protein|nr:hypothetical protein EF405_02995 [Cyclobacteriaceae bacterium YHN15]
MQLIKKLKSFTVLLMVFGFLFATTVSSCGNKKTEDQTEQSEHPSDEAEHPSDSTEHPSDGDEHPSSGEHPSNEDKDGE